jgi:hypothetical protein
MLREPGRPSHASCASRRPEGTNAVPASSCWRPGTRSRSSIGHVTEVTPDETGPLPGGFEAEFLGDEVAGCREG